MHLANINWLAVIIAAVAGWLVGAVWYTVLSKQWLAAQGKTMETAKQEAAGQSLPVLLIIVFVADLIMAVMLSGIMTHVGPFTVRSGLISGALIWFGFVITAIATNYAFQGRKPMLTLIDGGYWLAVLLVVGGILGAFGK
jgi:Protein of unknown function (DUF1761)